MFEVTELVATLRDAFDWDGSRVKVTVVPAGAAGGGDVRAGRISLYAG